MLQDNTGRDQLSRKNKLRAARETNDCILRQVNEQPEENLSVAHCLI
jgi:hypothetical protein